ncbi:hypothetical protein SFC08_01610 [Lysinibacillus halotolerans]
MSNMGQVEIPEWFELDGLEMLNTIINDQQLNGILLAGDNLEQARPYNPVVRIYLINLQQEKYEIVREVGAVTFKSKEEVTDFASNITSYSLIDLFYNLHNKQIEVTI